MQPSRLIRSLSFATSLLLVLGLAFMTTPASSAPQKPTKFRITKISATTSSAKITWTASKRATHYRVCLKSNGTTKKCSITSGKTKSRSVTVKKLKPTGGRDWFAQVSAHNKGGKTHTAKVGFDLKVGALASPTRTSGGTNFHRYSWKRPKNADNYHVQISPTKGFTSRVTTKSTKGRSITLSNLKDGTTYYTRVRGRNGSSNGRWSRPHTAKTTPQAPPKPSPTPPTVTPKPTVPTPPAPPSPGAPSLTGGHGHFLTFAWSEFPGADSYEVQISPDRSFATKVGSRTTADLTIHLDGLNGGSVYYTRLRAKTGATFTGWSPRATARLSQPDVDVSVATYNLCGEDKCRPGASSTFLKNVPAWSQRRTTAGALIRSGDPDVIVAQESVNSTTKFQTELPGYTVGSYHRGKSIFFRSSRFTSADRGGITLDATAKKFAAWEKLRDTKTGTTFYVINVHLTSGKNATRDKQRQLELTRMYSAMDTINAYGLPVVWSGDWNSNADNANQKKYPGGFDAPKEFFADRGIKDAIDLTPNNARINGQLNSANYGSVTPKASSHRIDAIYVENGTRVTSWRMLTHFTDGTDRYAKGKSYRSPFGSDHNPIVASLSLGIS